MNIQRIAVSLIIFANLAGVNAFAGAERGKNLYLACASCHGAEAQGISAMNAPALAGQSAAYLQRQLEHFKSGIRGGSGDTLGRQMAAMAATLPDANAVIEVSEYIASLPAVTVNDKAEGDLRNGNNRYQGNCGSCHGNKGEGNAALNSPALAYLDTVYFVRQYNNFKEGIRGSHADDKYGRQMKMMASSLPSDKDLMDVIAYIHSRSSE